jgi:hypothetical protein
VIVYLLIDGREFTPFKEKWRVFQDKEQCLAEARKLGWGSGMLGEVLRLGDEPGMVVHEGHGDVDITMAPIFLIGHP